jgi:hypothetical protein
LRCDLCRLSKVFLGLQATRTGTGLPTYSTTPQQSPFSDGMHGDAVAKFTILMIVLVDLPSGHLTWPARLAKDNERFGHLRKKKKKKKTLNH